MWPLTPHLCCVSKPNTFTDSPGVIIGILVYPLLCERKFSGYLSFSLVRGLQGEAGTPTGLTDESFSERAVLEGLGR